MGTYGSVCRASECYGGQMQVTLVKGLGQVTQFCDVFVVYSRNAIGKYPSHKH